MKELRIAVVGNCNAAILANCIRALRPEDQVDAFTVDHVLRTREQRFSDFDITFALANVDEFGLSPVIAECKSIFYWPNLIFFGFHPDITYFGIQGKPVRSAMGEYNSRIAATGYALGLSVRETCRLFDKDVYDRLEFFDKYPISRAGLLVAAENCGLDLSDALPSWERSGVFMYSINHPKLIVFSDLSKALLRLADLEFDPDLPLTDILPDFLANGGIWPVYPALAETIGVPGSMRFSPPTHGAYEIKTLTLEHFVEKTFAIYRADGFLSQHMRTVDGLKVMWNALAA
jgi:Polysaccharide biosynthesis enzyme WcbI